MSHLSWHRNPGSTERQLRNAGPVARLRGQIAQEQLARGRDFAQEQPHPSTCLLYTSDAADDM
eukprot:6825589-Alexandrium_andersonii.AAC.1